MTDRECREILKEKRAEMNTAYRYAYRERDRQVLDYLIDILSERILEEEHKSSMYEQVAHAFGKEK